MCGFAILQYKIDKVGLILGNSDFVLLCGFILCLVDVGNALVVIGLLIESLEDLVNGWQTGGIVLFGEGQTSGDIYFILLELVSWDEAILTDI